MGHSRPVRERAVRALSARGWSSSRGRASPVPNARELVFATLTESFTFVSGILEADRAAVEGRDTYDETYFAAFFSRVGPVLQQRLADSIRDIESVITAAWIEAGRPAVPLQVTRTPRPVRRQ